MFTLFAILFLVLGDWKWGTTDDPNQLSLWRDGRQVGSWKIAEREFWSLQGRQFVRAQCPIKEPQPQPPAEPVGPPVSLKGSLPGKPPEGGIINYGLDLSKCPTEGEIFSYNGNPINKAEATALMGAMDPIGAKVDPDTLTDDRSHYRLTIIGKGADKLLEKLKADPNWSEATRGVLAADYPSGSWHIRDKGYQSISPDRPTVYFTDAAGKALLVEDFAGEDTGALLDRIRKSRDPWSINWSSSWFGFNPLTWMIGIGWSRFHVPIEWVLLFLGGIVLAVLVLRKKPGPPQPPRPA